MTANSLTPTDSYWARPEFQSSREAFYAYLRDQQARIQRSPLGQQSTLVIGVPAFLPLAEREERFRQGRKKAMEAA